MIVRMVDNDKESNFYVLRKTHMPAVLFEAAFMDHMDDYDKLWSDQFLEEYTTALFMVIKDIYNCGI